MRSRGWVVAALVVGLVFPTPARAVSAAQFALNLSATTFQVGDTLTFSPVVTNAEPGELLRCEIWIEHFGQPESWVRMHVSSSGCEPWTFVVPPGPLGQYEVVGRLYIGLWEGRPTEHREVIQTVNLVEGGSPVPFVTNYPVQSWALEEIVSTSTPTFGEPMTIFPAATGDTCVLRTFGGLEVSYVWQRDGCVPWTFTIPERESQGPGTIFGDASDVQVMSWTGESPYTIEPEGGLVGAMFGETYVDHLPPWASGASSTTEYASNLPAIFAGRQRGYVGQAGDPSPVVIAPVVVGMTEGTCLYTAQPGSTPVVPGGCQDPVTIPGSYTTGTSHGGAHLELRDSLGALVATGELWVGWVDDMSAWVEAPENVDTGEEATIDAATDTGAPATYEVVAELEPASTTSMRIERDVATTATLAGAAGSTIIIARGVLEPTKDSAGDAISVDHAFAMPGRYRVTATFTDVRGESSSGSTVIQVTNEDATKPTVTAPKNAFVAGSTISSGKTPVRYTWTGSDSGSGVARYHAAISKDGGAWTTISTSLTSPALTRNLAAGHTYRLRVRAVDKAGNVGAWVAGPTFRLKAYQESSSAIVRRGTWKLASSSNFWGGGERFSKTAGSKAKLTFTGRSFAWVGSMGPSRGSARVYVNGTLVKKVSLYAPSASYRRVLVTLSWKSANSRTVKIVVVGTAGHPRVNIDAFVTGT